MYIVNQYIKFISCMLYNYEYMIVFEDEENILHFIGLQIEILGSLDSRFSVYSGKKVNIESPNR